MEINFAKGWRIRTGMESQWVLEFSRLSKKGENAGTVVWHREGYFMDPRIAIVRSFKMQVHESPKDDTMIDTLNALDALYNAFEDALGMLPPKKAVTRPVGAM